MANAQPKPAPVHWWNDLARPFDYAALTQMFRDFFHSPAVAFELSIAYPGNWVPIKYLGDNGAHVALFARVDLNNRMVQRLVVKELTCHAGRWWDPTLWAGPTDGNDCRNYDAGFDHTESRETIIQGKLSMPDQDYIVHLVGHSAVEQKHWRFRSYLEYAALGTLEDVILHYRDARNFPDALTLPRREYDGSLDVLPVVHIPEPFIWRCAQHLTAATILMENGPDDQQSNSNGWKAVVHRDIKPANIFLCSPPTGRQAQWRLYPYPKLADFDLAIETSPDDPYNPRSYQGAGTSGFLAPEQIAWIYTDRRSYYDPPRLGSATQVYAIGLILYCLVFRVTRPDPDYTHGTKLGPPVDGIGRPIPCDRYSHVLRDLMWGCLRYLPDERPSLAFLHQQLTSKALDEDNILYKGMRLAVPTPGQPWYDNDRNWQHGLNMRFEDGYRLGLNRSDLPEPEDPYDSDEE